RGRGAIEVTVAALDQRSQGIAAIVAPAKAVEGSEDSVCGHPEECAQRRADSVQACPVEISIAGLDQAGQRSGPVHPVGEGVQDGKAAAGPDLESGAIEPGAAVNRRAIEIAIGPLNHTGVWVKGTGAAAEKARDGYEGPRGV